jgi:hypothetical protein
MAKFEEPFEETQALYDEKINAIGLNNYMTITVIVNNMAKDIVKVTKASEMLKYRCKDDIIIILNEKIFDQLTPEQREIVVEDSLAGIHYDNEKDKLVVGKADFSTFSGLLKKYGAEQCVELKELIKLIYSQEREAEAEAEG